MFSSNTEHNDENDTIGDPCHHFISSFVKSIKQFYGRKYEELILQMNDFVSAERNL